jgi:hypothetical protein
MPKNEYMEQRKPVSEAAEPMVTINVDFFLQK